MRSPKGDVVHWACGFRGMRFLSAYVAACFVWHLQSHEGEIRLGRHGVPVFFDGIVSCRSCLQPFPLFQLREKTMPNYFYNDANGQTQGPFDEQQLQELADQGVITPNTPLATDGGHSGLAGQIRGLRFRITVPASDPPPYTQTVSQRSSWSHSPTGESTRSIFLWPLDFAFRDLRLPVIILWVCRIFYAIVFGVIVLWGIFTTVAILIVASQQAQPVDHGQFGQFGHFSQFGRPEQLGATTPIMAFLFILAVWLFVAFYIVIIRMAYEFFLMIFNWIDETTKAARIYIENNEKE